MSHLSKIELTKGSNVNGFQSLFYYLYVFVVVLSFSPFNLIAYFLPFIFLLCVFFAWPFDKLFKRSLICLYVAGVLVILYGLIYPDLIFQNAFLALLTYSSLVPVIVLPNHILAGESLFKKILSFNQKLLLLEGSIGIIQAIYGFSKNGSFSEANGDYVEGTIHLGLEPEQAFSNPIFVVNMIFACLLAFIAVTKFQYKPYPLIFGVLSIVLASVVHALLFLILAVVIVVCINCIRVFKNPKIFIGILISIVLVSSTSFYFIGSNIGLVPHFVEQAENLESPRSRITRDTFSTIPEEYPLMPYIGLGPGQFSSRASLIGSGHYFGGFDNPRSLPLLTPEVSAPMKRYLLPLWASAAKKKYYGSTQQPYYSWLSIYSEFGFLGSFIVFISVVFFLFKFQFLRIERRKIVYAFTFQTGILFLFLLGAQENYWEVTQIMFLGLIYLKLLYANILSRDTKSLGEQHV